MSMWPIAMFHSCETICTSFSHLKFILRSTLAYSKRFVPWLFSTTHTFLNDSSWINIDQNRFICSLFLHSVKDFTSSKLNKNVLKLLKCSVNWFIIFIKLSVFFSIGYDEKLLLTSSSSLLYVQRIDHIVYSLQSITDQYTNASHVMTYRLLAL